MYNITLGLVIKGKEIRFENPLAKFCMSRLMNDDTGTYSRSSVNPLVYPLN